MPPLCSVFTPTNNPKYLEDVYVSLQNQTYTEWEWLVLLNGDARANLPDFLKDTRDARIRLLDYPDTDPFESAVEPGTDEESEPPAEPAHELKDTGKPVGALKAYCCKQAKGDVFVELDHDDLLIHDTLERVVDKVEAGAGFIYSDAAVLVEHAVDDDVIRTSIGYGPAHGWETYEFMMYGNEYLASRCFDLTPRSLCEVYYAPDHVRCWTREAYEKSGGHDVRLTVCDDHDLICRTYLQGTKFAHIGGCGYVYRMHPGNTVKLRQKQIREQTVVNRRKYTIALIEEWVRRKKLESIQISRKQIEEFNVMQNVPDLRQPGTVGALWVYDVLQFLSQPLIGPFMEACYRALVPGGYLNLAVPSTNGQGAFTPTAKSYWNAFSLTYFTVRHQARELGTHKTARFQMVDHCEGLPNKDARQHRHTKEFKLQYLYATMCAIKGQRQPGMVHI